MEPGRGGESLPVNLDVLGGEYSVAMDARIACSDEMSPVSRPSRPRLRRVADADDTNDSRRHESPNFGLDFETGCTKQTRG